MLLPIFTLEENKRIESLEMYYNFDLKQFLAICRYLYSLLRVIFLTKK